MGLQTGTKSYDYALEPRSNTVPTRTSKTEERQGIIRECGDGDGFSVAVAATLDPCSLTNSLNGPDWPSTRFKYVAAASKLK